MARTLALGLDFGTDSVRALLVDTRSGAEVANATSNYKRWAQGRYCDPSRQQFRQHPQDHIDAMQDAVRKALREAGRGAAAQVAGIGVDTTGSSPMPIAHDGRALALVPGFTDDPDAMCVLWKDHTSVEEAGELNDLAHGGRFTDYTRWVGGIYSSEWFWAKIAHVVRHNRRVAAAAYTWMEHCDWVPFILTGGGDPVRAARSRCAAGHKALWHASWDGLPDEQFLTKLEPRLAGLRSRLYAETVTADRPAGRLSRQWAQLFGLPTGITVASGAFDAHLGAVGAGAKPHVLVKVMGTSTCDMLITPAKALGSRTVRGICGQVDGSIVPGFIGLEAGQSAFGDIFAWYKRLLAWPLASLSSAQRARIADKLLPELERAASKLPPLGTGELAVDWFNGRRTPDADQSLRGCISGLHLGSDAPTVYRALVEASVYGARAIVERFVSEGVTVSGVQAIGGIARKSPLIMQTCADVLARPVEVMASDECCALGAAIAGATAAGLHKDMASAQRAMASSVERTYRPNKKLARIYDAGYARYLALGAQTAAKGKG